MSETSIVRGTTTTQSLANTGETRKVEVKTLTGPVDSSHVTTDRPLFAVRVASSGERVALNLDVQLLLQQRAIQETNKEIQRRLRS